MPSGLGSAGYADGRLQELRRRDC